MANPMNDRVVEYVVSLAQKTLHPSKIVLFGSRARGDFKKRSDYDFAVSGEDIPREAWVRFKLEAEEKAPTLKELDFVRLEEVEDNFRDQILKEGIVVYEARPHTRQE